MSFDIYISPVFLSHWWFYVRAGLGVETLKGSRIVRLTNFHQYGNPEILGLSLAEGKHLAVCSTF